MRKTLNDSPIVFQMPSRYVGSRLLYDYTISSTNAEFRLRVFLVRSQNIPLTRFSPVYAQKETEPEYNVLISYIFYCEK